MSLVPVLLLELPPVPGGAHVPYGLDSSQFAEVRRPNGSAPVVVLLHGGFWRAKYDLGHLSHLCAALTREGLCTWNVEYRRVGQAGGGWPGTFDDVRAALNLVRSQSAAYGGDPSRMVIAGHSAGGHLALWLAAQAVPVRGVVALAPVADLEEAWRLGLSHHAVGELLGGPREEVPERYRIASPMALPITVGQHLIHGSADDIVPVEMSRAYAQHKASEGEAVTLTELPGAGHFDLIDPGSGVWPVVRDSILALVS